MEEGGAEDAAPGRAAPSCPCTSCPWGSHPSMRAPGHGHPHSHPSTSLKGGRNHIPAVSTGCHCPPAGARHCAGPLEIPHGTQDDGNPCSLYRQQPEQSSSSRARQSTDDWLKMCYIHAMDCDSAIKKTMKQCHLQRYGWA